MIASVGVLIRSAAVGLILASVVYLVKERLWWRAVAFATVVALCLLPWLAYSSMNAASAEQRAGHGGAVVYGYGDQFWMRWAGTPALGRITANDLPGRIAVNLTDISARSMVGIFVPTLLRGANESGEEVASLGGLAGLLPGSMGIATATMAISLGLSAIVLVGFIDAARRRATIVEFLVPMSLAIVLLWPFWSFRFVLPLTPYLFFYLVTGLQLITRSRRIVRIAVLCIIGLNLVDHTDYILQARQGRDSEWVRDSHAVDAALEWISGNLPRDGLIASTNPALLYLRTGRRSIAYDDPAVELSAWKSRGCRYLISLLPTRLPAGRPGEVEILYQSRARLWVVELRRMHSQ